MGNPPSNVSHFDETIQNHDKSPKSLPDAEGASLSDSEKVSPQRTTRASRYKANRRRSCSLQSLPDEDDVPLANSEKISPKTRVRSLRSTPVGVDTTTQFSKTPERKMTRSRRSTPSSSAGKSSEENMNVVYGIGEYVYVKVARKHYGAVVTNVDYGSDSGDGKGRVVYEVEYSDGEEACVDPQD